MNALWNAPISDCFSSLCARVFSLPAAILESEKTLGTRLSHIGKENNHVVVHGMVVHYKLVHFMFCVCSVFCSLHSPPQSPSFLGHVVGYKLSRVALGTRMAQPAFLNRFSVNSLHSRKEDH